VAARDPVRWLGKASLFAGWRGPVMRALGGIPVQRDDASRVVAEVVERVRSGEVRPRGDLRTAPRDGNTHWKSGFYRIGARDRYAGDARLRRQDDDDHRLGPTIELTGDVAADMDVIRAFYADKAACGPSAARSRACRTRPPGGPRPAR
jgi:hypothetical protein